MEKIRACKKFEEIGLKVELPRRIGPKMIIYDVPNEISESEILNEMYDRNLKEHVEMKEMKERVRIISRGSKKGATAGNVIIEVSKKIKERLLSQGRLYVKWNAFKIREFESVSRCLSVWVMGIWPVNVR